ncbi:MAG: hypothetical protein KC620_26055 [Myxococcales bacterium]|nr:hypothetical protein [Myxococcales bacterium]
MVLISGLAPLGDALDPTVRALRRDLGCAARREGDDVAVTGDLTDRVIAWLEAHGARRIVRGN